VAWAGFSSGDESPARRAALPLGRLVSGGCLVRGAPALLAIQPREVVADVAVKASRERLEKEANAAADFFKSVTDFFSQKPEEPTPAELAAMERREAASVAAQEVLKGFRLAVVSGQDDDGAAVRRQAPIGVLQAKAGQSLAFFTATTEKVLTDVLLSMRIEQKEFSERNLLVVPVLVDLESRALLDLSERMLKSKLLNQGSVALPAMASEEDRAKWGDVFADEFAEAQVQGQGPQAISQGLAVLMRSDGQIVRRGVGRPMWKSIFVDLGI